MDRVRKTVERTCQQCQRTFPALLDNVKKGWGKFCSKPCWHAWRGVQPGKVTPLRNRRLRPDDPRPTSTPRRYVTRDGYAVLRWKVGPREYVEALEHREVVGGAAEHVHHRNGDKLDNRPENLEPISASAHAQKHVQPSFDTEEAARLYAEGWSLPQLARKYGVHNVSVMRTLKKRGVKMRTVKESWAVRKRSEGYTDSGNMDYPPG